MDSERMVHVNVGSNKGNSRLNLSRAMRGIGEVFGPYEISHVVTSPPWGFKSNRNFLNMGIQFLSSLPAEEILDKLLKIQQGISHSSHRTPSGGYADREIDIDIVAIDDEVIETEKLKVPHPHLAERRFFLEPLEELAPSWQHPLTGETVAEMLSKLGD